MRSIAALAVLLVMPAVARAQSFSIAGRVGTTGPSLEAGLRVGERIGVRAGMSFLDWTYRHKLSGVSYDAKLKFTGKTALVDFYLRPGGSFHFTAGVSTPPVEVTAVGTSSLNHFYVINGRAWPEADVGVLQGEATWPDLSPYAGFGWSGGLRGDRVAMVFDLGATFGGPDFSLTATGAATNPELAADIAAEQVASQRDLDKILKVFPVVTLGLRVRL